jgi:hypothetical protein
MKSEGSEYMSWYVEVGFSTTPQLDDDAAFDLMSKLGGVPMGRSADLTENEIGVWIDAETAADASLLGIAMVKGAALTLIHDVDVTSIEVMTESKFEFENARPLFPEVVGYAEIAKLADVSRQRARELAESKSFPRPVIKTAQGPLFAKAAVEAWSALRSRKPGRPRKNTMPITA